MKMKKYIGFVKKVNNSVTTKSVKLLTRYSDDKNYLERWLKTFPNAETVILENNEIFQSFFKDFEDYSLVPKE